MPKIKTRETHRDIKVLDKASVAGERMKNAFIRSKDTAANLMDDGQIAPEEYAEDRVQHVAEDIAHDVGHTATKEGKKLAKKGRDAILEHREHPKESEQRYGNYESTDAQVPSQEAARQNTIRQTEVQAAKHQQHGLVAEAEPIDAPHDTPVVAEPVVQPVPEGRVPTQDTVSFSAGRIDSPAYPSHSPQRDPVTLGSVRSAQRITPNTYYMQSTYVQGVPSPAIQKWQWTQATTQSKGELPMMQPVPEAPETTIAFEPKVRPLQSDKQSVTEIPNPSVVRPKTNSSHDPGVVRDSKGIMVRNVPDAPEIEQPTPIGRERQLAIKKAEKKAEVVRAEQLRLGSDREIQKVAKAAQLQQIKGTIKVADRVEKTINQSARSMQKAGIKTAQKTAKSSRKAVKTAEQTSKTAIKATQATVEAVQKSAQAAAKTAQKTAYAARTTARAAVVAEKAVVKAVAAASKSILAGVQESVTAIAAGGWMAVVPIVFMCLIGLILITPFGIFFSGSNRDDGAVLASAAVAQVNYEFASRLEALQDGDYDDIVIEGSMADWPEVLAVFAVKVTASEDVDATDVATLDPARIAKLTAVFWDMNNISSEVETIDHPDSDPDDEVDDSWTERTLQITIFAKTAEEMKTQYCFSEKQKAVLVELLENRDALEELIRDLKYISADAESVLRHLPDDLSDERRKVVKTACSLVGKVNYFWGGKSLVIGWDPLWGSVQKVWAAGSLSSGTYRPYGLDCSGFVDWVFYNASDGFCEISHGGGASAQHSNCCSIPWDEALPGDLVFYPDDTHVGIVAGEDEDGNLLIVHCSGTLNCVVITISSGFCSTGTPSYYNE